jgi:hypothetical protein
VLFITSYFLDCLTHFLLICFFGVQPQQYMQVAEKAASFIRRQLYNEQTHRLQHSFRNGPSKAPGFLDDYAFLISGLLDLFEFGGGIKWLLWATELQETQARTNVQLSYFQVIIAFPFSHLVFLNLVENFLYRMNYFLIEREAAISIPRGKTHQFSFV